MGSKRQGPWFKEFVSRTEIVDVQVAGGAECFQVTLTLHSGWESSAGCPEELSLRSNQWLNDRNGRVENSCSFTLGRDKQRPQRPLKFNRVRKGEGDGGWEH